MNFHWTHGATLRFTPGNGKRSRLSLSVFAEQDADIDTDAERTRVGGALEWKPWWGAFGDGSAGGGGSVIVQRSVRFLRLSVYGDWASAEGADYCAVGAGLVFMDGLLRLDLAKGLDCGREGSSRAGWKFHPRGFTFF